MKVTCKSIKGYDDDFWRGSITIGSEYEVLQIIKDEYLIMNNYGFEHLYNQELFITKQDLREDKLKELGI